MLGKSIRAQLAIAGRLVNGWCSLPCAFAAAILAHQGYDTLTIDMQHGAMGYDTAFAMLQAIGNGPATPLVRACRYPPRGFRSFGPNRAVLSRHSWLRQRMSA